MTKYLRVSVYDYKGGELSTKLSDEFMDLIDEDSKKELKKQLYYEGYACADEGMNPTAFFHITDNGIKEMSYQEIINLLSPDFK